MVGLPDQRPMPGAALAAAAELGTALLPAVTEALVWNGAWLAEAAAAAVATPQRMAP